MGRPQPIRTALTNVMSVKFLLTLGTGFYLGLYAAQAHPDKVPQVTDPQDIAIKVREWIDEYTKPKNW